MQRRDKSINYVEFGVADMTRTKAFYASAFGWTFTDYGPDYCEFSDGQMQGGFDASVPPRPGLPLIVLYGDDLEGLQKAVTREGGSISKPIFDFLGGKRFQFIDPNGYELGVWSAA